MKNSIKIGKKMEDGAQNSLFPNMESEGKKTKTKTKKEW
jgi:hypothetical protein